MVNCHSYNYVFMYTVYVYTCLCMLMTVVYVYKLIVEPLCSCPYNKLAHVRTALCNQVIAKNVHLNTREAREVGCVFC